MTLKKTGLIATVLEFRAEREACVVPMGKAQSRLGVAHWKLLLYSSEKESFSQLSESKHRCSLDV